MPVAQRTRAIDRLSTIRRQLDQLLDDRVRAIVGARRDNHSWAEIADAIGVSRQSAWELFRDQIAIFERNRDERGLTEEDALELAIAATRETRRHRR